MKRSPSLTSGWIGEYRYELGRVSYVKHRLAIEKVDVDTVGIEHTGDVDNNRDGLLELIP